MRARIIGLGEIGIRVALAALDAGFTVVGFDASPLRCEQITAGLGKPLNRIAAFGKRFVLCESLTQAYGTFDVTFVCVPTWDKVVGLNAELVRDVLINLAPMLGRGEVVCVESTVPVNATRTVLKAALEASGHIIGETIHLVYSPERVDSSLDVGVSEIPKLFSGITPGCTRAGRSIYSRIASTVIEVDTVEVAEAAKLLENCFRLVNVSFINEFAHLMALQGIDVCAVISAASTKPFGFMPFTPRGRAGGHCVPAAGRALEHAARVGGAVLPTVFAANQSNDAAGQRLAADLTARIGAAPANVLLLGMGYKDDCASYTESVGIDLGNALASQHYRVYAADITNDFGELLRDDVHCCDLEDIPRLVHAIVICSWRESFTHIVPDIRAGIIVDLTGKYAPAKSHYHPAECVNDSLETTCEGLKARPS